MNKSLLRLIFVLPVLCGVLESLSFFGERVLPEAAQHYVQWYVSQPLAGISLVLNRFALVGLLGVVLSTVGLLLFWSPSRYLYLLSVVLVLPEQAAALPVLVTGWESFLDNLAQITVGLNIGLMFSKPGSNYFGSSASTA